MDTNKSPKEIPQNVGPPSTKKIDIVEGDMLVIFLTCSKFIVNRTMLTWGTFSTRAPSVDVMYFWPGLSCWKYALEAIINVLLFIFLFHN